MIDDDFKVKLSDFGWSIHAPNNSRYSMCGTAEYLSPELIKNEEYDNEFDNYCIGIMTYELTVGNAPFLGENNKEL